MEKINRLIISPWREDQAKDFFELTQDEGFNLYPINIYRQSDLKAASAWLTNTISQNKESSLGKWAVYESSTGNLIGMGGLTPWKLDDEDLIDITYRLRQSAWGKGYGLELAKELVKLGFEKLGLEEITATITPDNFPSKRIAEKLGMKFDKNIILLGVLTDLYRLKK
jgi:[ribosomal protein S5]-alanine N-acetyltransferase